MGRYEGAPQRPLRITHIITGLGRGGAERSLYRLLANLPGEAVECDVVSLTGRDVFTQDIEDLGVNVTALDMDSSLIAAFRGFIRLWQLLRLRRPNVVQAWMYHANLVGGVAARLAGIRTLVWNVRHTPVLKLLKRRTRLVIRLLAVVSHRLPTAVIYCAHSSNAVHERLGFRPRTSYVIPNGVESPAAVSDRTVREELGLEPDALVVVRLARFHPHKDYPTLIRAAAILQRDFPDLHWIFCGDGVDDQNWELMRCIEQFRLDKVVHLLGPRDDVPAVLAAGTVACSSSVTEGFPNAILEAMAVGLPVVATDAGDSSWLVGSTGRIVPVGSPKALAGALGEVLRGHPDITGELGRAARARALREFSVQKMTSAYLSVYQKTAGRQISGSAPREHLR